MSYLYDIITRLLFKHLVSVHSLLLQNSTLVAKLTELTGYRYTSVSRLACYSAVHKYLPSDSYNVTVWN